MDSYFPLLMGNDYECCVDQATTLYPTKVVVLIIFSAPQAISEGTNTSQLHYSTYAL
jgi:hypothetical protein